MSSLKEGTRVKCPDELIGHIQARYDMGSVVYYIVRIDEDGSLYKFFADQLTEIEEEPEEEPTESDTITITRAEFREKIADVIAEIMYMTEVLKAEATRAVLNNVAPMICANTENALFGEPKENV